MNISNDGNGMSITRATLSKTYAANGETITLNFTLKLASNAVVGNISGDIEIGLGRYGGTQLRAAIIPGVYIARGASKAFTVEVPVKKAASMISGEYANIAIYAHAVYGAYYAVIGDAFVYIAERVAPAITSLEFDETTSYDQTGINISQPNLPKRLFGFFVQNVSIPKLTADVTLDPQDPTLTMQHSLVLKQGDDVIFSASGAETPGSIKILCNNINVFGAVSYEYTVTDSAGISATESGSFDVYAYTPPVITQFRPARYEYVYDSNGDQVLQESETGTIVIIDFSGTMTPIASDSAVNRSIISLTYGPAYDESDRTTVRLGTETEAAVTRVLQIPDVEFSDAQEYTFALSYQDYFRTASATAEVYKAGGDLDLTNHGAAIGMISTADMEHPKFEVAPTHESHFYGGIAGVTNYAASGVEEATGGKWIDGKPIYRFMCTATTSAVGGVTIGNLPEVPDTIISLTGVFKRGTDNAWISVHNAYYTNLGWSVNIMTDGGTALNVTFGGSNTGTKTVIVIAEYTKSTD